MVSLHVTLSYYKRQDIREAIVCAAKDKEIAIRFGEDGFGKRPDALFYPDDVLEAAKNGHITPQKPEKQIPDNSSVLTAVLP